MSQALINARDTMGKYRSSDALYDLLAVLHEAVTIIEETEPPLWPAAKGCDDINDRAGELENLLFSPDANIVDLRVKAEEIAISAIRFIRDVCGDK